jgi:hypothetical protein
MRIAHRGLAPLTDIIEVVGRPKASMALQATLPAAHQGCVSSFRRLGRHHLFHLATAAPRGAPRMIGGRAPRLRCGRHATCRARRATRPERRGRSLPRRYVRGGQWQHGDRRQRQGGSGSQGRLWRHRFCRHGCSWAGSRPPLLAPRLPPGHPLPPLFGFDLAPHLGPAVITDRVAQRQHRVDVGTRPAHARPLQPRLHHHRMRTFDAATADRQPLCLELGIL